MDKAGRKRTVVDGVQKDPSIQPGVGVVPVLQRSDPPRRFRLRGGVIVREAAATAYPDVPLGLLMMDGFVDEYVVDELPEGCDNPDRWRVGEQKLYMLMPRGQMPVSGDDEQYNVVEEL